MYIIYIYIYIYIYVCIITAKRETKKKYEFAVTLSFMFNQFSNCLNPILGKEGGRGKFYPPPSCWFSLNNSEKVKAVPWHFAVFSNILLEMFDPTLVFMTGSSLQIFGKTQEGVFPISGFLVNSL